MIATGGSGIEINLTAVILAMRGDEPVVYASSLGATMPPGLPSGPFDPGRHRTLELGLRSFAQEQAGLTLGYVEQLYTFGDRGRLLPEGSGEAAALHLVSIGYLALTRMAAGATQRENFLPLYTFFPWEDWRGGRPDILDRVLLPALERWAGEAEAGSDAEGRGLTRRERLALSFGVDGTPFDEEKVLERYELLYSAGLVDEAVRDRRQAAMPDRLRLGQVMPFDHRRIVATALGRLRGKLKYRPVVFELMADQFTLTDLQRKVEAISGHHLHKQNFRRLVETGGLVEPTGEQTTTKGRPAALFRFRREVLRERPAPGLRLSARSSG
ncbi:MAG: NAD regulator [Beijerinckiaceae bacterium]|nr:NAD regulator [Beijerinckiaceae bacterium]MCZ8298836.1 NAD regulator [Beijerinckiaceae bacterium]